MQRAFVLCKEWLFYEVFVLILQVLVKELRFCTWILKTSEHLSVSSFQHLTMPRLSPVRISEPITPLTSSLVWTGTKHSMDVLAGFLKILCPCNRVQSSPINACFCKRRFTCTHDCGRISIKQCFCCSLHQAKFWSQVVNEAELATMAFLRYSSIP